ncbi:hypothetical protein MK489_02665 [Myxococcota bacterium]|nr:hypothetical protein [Myxococcota bacterium]
MPSPTVVYFDHAAAPGHNPAPFTSGEAGFVWLNASREFESDTQFEIPPNTLHALHGHGVVEELNQLDLSLGPIGGGRESVLSPASMEKATHLFYEADRMTYGAIHDLRVGRRGDFEYRIVVDNRGYQRVLSKLQFLCGRAARMGRGVRLKL